MPLLGLTAGELTKPNIAVINPIIAVIKVINTVIQVSIDFILLHPLSDFYSLQDWFVQPFVVCSYFRVESPEAPNKIIHKI